MMKQIWVLMLCMVSCGAYAENIYKCVQDGRLTISSAPCPADAASTAVTPDATPTVMYRCVQDGRLTISGALCPPEAVSTAVAPDAAPAAPAASFQDELARLKQQLEVLERERLQSTAPKVVVLEPDVHAATAYDINSKENTTGATARDGLFLYDRGWRYPYSGDWRHMRQSGGRREATAGHSNPHPRSRGENHHGGRREVRVTGVIER
jgi:hypothetical protein